MPTYQFPERQMRYDPSLPKPDPTGHRSPHVPWYSCEALQRVASKPPLQPDDARLIGAAYEEGRCFERSWDRAERYYVQAVQGGNMVAAAALALHYAGPGDTQDLAAAMWWAHRGRMPMAQDCKVTGFGPKPMTVDAFVEELRTMSATRLRGCVYGLAFVGAVLQDYVKTWSGLSEASPARIGIALVPHSGRYSLMVTDADGGSNVHEGLISEPVVAGDRTIIGYYSRMVQRAASRASVPDGLAPDLRVGMSFAQAASAKIDLPKQAASAATRGNTQP